ncbi:uncharacterized protein [Apostichopus japonicus]|uniref:uncharacterized protein isoform X2 n=1 Tax=Stichopus japonicus TaxID=307972 RepID=UPI003AB50D73
MSLLSSIDKRKFRDEGDRGRNDYAYADPIEELGRGRRADRHHHGRDRGFPMHDYREPIFVHPRSQRFLSTGPIVTTPSMDPTEREFRDEGDRGRIDYAYADPIEELGRGRRADRHHHGRDRGFPMHDYREPIFVQPRSQRFLSAGPIVTTASMDLQLPSRPQPRYPPGYPPDNRQDQNSLCKDLFLAFAAIFIIVCCPIGLCFGIPAILCIFQAKDEEARGSLGESQRSRLYSLSISAIGCCVGLLLTIVVVTYYALTYEETTQDSTFNNYVL